MEMPTSPKIHEGRNVKRIREMLGIKQEVLAEGLKLNQQKISLLEQKETIDPELLEQVAKILKVPVDAIKNFNEEAAYNYINTFNDNSTGAFNNYDCTFNPIDKIVQLYEEKIALYERMLKEKDSTIQKLSQK